jgi:hypothetical protein
MCLTCLIHEKSRFSSIKRLYKIYYRLFKDNFEFENYFNILEDKDIYTLCKFRTTNHKLPIETGRWNGIDRENTSRRNTRKGRWPPSFNISLHSSEREQKSLNRVSWLCRSVIREWVIVGHWYQLLLLHNWFDYGALR